MKKTTIWTYVKRAFLILILLIVVVFVSIYFLDVYKISSSAQSYNNSYKDSFWNKEDLEKNGFVSFKDITTEQSQADCKLTGTYIAPYDESDDYATKLRSARYKEELELIKEVILSENPNLESDSNYIDIVNEVYAELSKKTDDGSVYSWVNYNREHFTKMKVLSNDNYELLFDLTTAEFEFNQKNPTTGEVIETWLSNPEKKDGAIALENLQSSQMTITCVDGNKASTKTPIIFNSYANSTQNSPDLFCDASYYVNLIKDNDGNIEKVLVFYEFSSKGIDYTYVPKTITLARLRELFDRCNTMVANNKLENGEDAVLLDKNKQVIEGLGYGQEMSKYSAAANNFYNLVIDTLFSQVEYKTITGPDGTVYNSDIISDHILNPDCNYDILDENGNPKVDEKGYIIKGYRDCPICSNVNFEIKNYDTMSENSANAAYRFFYEWCDYDMHSDMKIDIGSEKQEPSGARVTAAIEYTLSENGLEVKIPGNSITTNKNTKGDSYMVTSMDLLPYFTSIKRGNNEGYVVIPDGSGVVMEFDNGKANYSAYSKRIYSSDLAFTSYTLKADTSDLLLPMYAYVNTKANKAMVVEAKEGAAQVALSADTSARGKNTFNHAQYSIIFREQQRIVVGTNQYARAESTQYTQKGAFSDYTFSYMCLDLEKYECSYSGVAKFYRDLLIERSEGKLDENADKTTKAILNLDVLGSYSYDTNFLGIPYTGKGTLTTVDELEIILNEITGLGIENINVYYKGWRSTGLKSVSFEKIRVNKSIGGKKALLDLINNYNDNVNIYPYLQFTEYEEYQRSFGKMHYTTRDVGGDYASKYPYELNSNVFNKKLDEIMVLSPAYYDAFSKELSANFSKLLDINTLAIGGLGSELSGDYRKKVTVFKSNAITEQIKAFDNLYNAGINDIALETPYAYALEYASNVYNVPYQSTQYEILDYNIPFYQLVINGLFDYSGESINENVEKGLMEHTMRCIETGSNPAFTFTYDDSSELLQTTYNNYYYTLYSRWLGDVEKVCAELNSLGIYNAKLVKHERLSNDVYKVTYQNNVETIEIILNYQRVAWSDGTITIPAKSYQKIDTSIE